MQVDLIETRLLYPKSRHVRSAGIHISSVHRMMAVENGVLRRELANRPEEFGLVEVGGDEWWESLTEDVQLKIAMGLAWEEWYIPQLEDVVDHPGEMSLEGIYLTHDGESLDCILFGLTEAYELCIHEVKLTYKSINTVGNLATQWLWLAQCKAYCKARGCRIAYAHVNFACGDYSFPIRPKLQIWRIIFTPLEMDAHWDMVKEYIAHFLEQGVEL